MKDRDRYVKLVEWSEEDQCYIGRCPGVMFGGVHGDNEAKVIKELSEVVDEWIEILRKDGKSLPTPTAGKRYSGKFVLRVGEDLHRALAMRALQAGQSLNNYSRNMLLNTMGQEELGAITHPAVTTQSARFTARPAPTAKRRPISKAKMSKAK